MSGIHTYITRLLALGLLMGSLGVHVAEEIIDFPAVAPDVPFDDVTALPFRAANHRLSYGEDLLQYALLWNPVLTADASPKALIVLIHGGCA